MLKDDMGFPRIRGSMLGVLRIRTINSILGSKVESALFRETII